MTLNQEQQISQYFDHAMSSAEEQNFLITLAASDGMRIAFRSQLELMKAVRGDADRLRSVSAGRTTAVRDRTLAALGLSATAAAPFIEQEAMRHSADLSTDINATPSAPHRAGFLSKPKYALGTGLFLGFMSAIAVLNVAGSGNSVSPASRVAQPAIITPLAPQNRTNNETIPASADLHREADERSSAAVTGHTRTVRHHAVQTAATSHLRTATKPTVPEISTTNPAKVNVKTKIEKPADDRSPADNSTKAP